MRCPKCGSTKITEHEDAYWYLCRDCGFNSQPADTKEKAIQNFEKGENYDEQHLYDFMSAVFKATNAGKDEFICPICGATARCGKSSYNGHCYAECKKCRTRLMQ